MPSARTMPCCWTNSSEKCNGNVKNWQQRKKDDPSVLLTTALFVPGHVFCGARTGVGGGAEHVGSGPAGRRKHEAAGVVAIAVCTAERAGIAESVPGGGFLCSE